jgi:DNA polymerase iota
LGELRQRLVLGSHLARHMRSQLEEKKGHTSTVGISTSKLLSKLVGNVNKPNDQTTLLPPYVSYDSEPSNVSTFIDGHDIGKIPNIGFKMAHKLREYALQHLNNHPPDDVNHEGRTVTVYDVRTMADIGPSLLDKILSGPGMPHGIGARTWALLNGIDDTEVGQARELPRQISIEDSYGCLDNVLEVHKQLLILSTSLINRMRIDLTEDETEQQDPAVVLDSNDTASAINKRWLAHPKTLRLSTRPRPPRNLNGSRARTFNRVSRSTSVPTYMYNLTETVEALANRLVETVLLPLFRRIHPEKTGWDLSLLNIAVTNLVEAASSNKQATGRDIGMMFKNQEDHLRAWKVVDRDISPDEAFIDIDNDINTNNSDTPGRGSTYQNVGSEDRLPLSQVSQFLPSQGEWDEEDADMGEQLSSTCPICASEMPYFAMAAHLRFHESED